MNCHFAEDCHVRFSRIYDDREWGEGSGDGSEAERCETFLRFFRHYYGDKHILDFGCGDLRLWKIGHFVKFPGDTYSGVDIVDSLINQHRATYGTDGKQFIHGSLSDTLVQEIGASSEVVLMKDVLQHWPLKDIVEAMAIIAFWQSYGVDIVLSNEYDPSFPGSNGDIELGGIRPLDLTAPPFNLKPKLCFYWELANDPRHYRKQVVVI